MADEINTIFGEVAEDNIRILRHTKLLSIRLLIFLPIYHALPSLTTENLPVFDPMVNLPCSVKF